jgi:formate dehydrogenase major subunit
VLPATATWAEGEGTVTNSERRVQRVRKAVEPPDGARDEIWIMSELAKRLGYDWGHPTAEEAWNELRSLSPQLYGMSYERLEQLNGIQWPCPDTRSSRDTIPARATLGNRSGEAWQRGAIFRRASRRPGRAARR